MEIVACCGEVDDVVLEVRGAVPTNVVSFQNVSFEDERTSQSLCTCAPQTTHALPRVNK